MRLVVDPFLEFVAASAYIVGLVEVARWLGGWLGPVVAVATPVLAFILLAVVKGAADVEIRRKP